METSSAESPLSMSFDDQFNSDFDESPEGHSSLADSLVGSIQQTPTAYVSRTHKRKFFQVAEGKCLRQRKDVVGDIDGALVVGITDIQDGVGMYVEPSEDEYFAWHIKPPGLPPAYPGFIILNPLKDQEPSKRDLKRITELHKEYLQRTLGSPQRTVRDNKFIIVTPSPSSVNVAIIEGILSWAGVELREDGRHWRASPEVQHNKGGFIVARPDSVWWYLTHFGIDAEPGSDRDWKTGWEAVKAGGDDERGDVRARRCNWGRVCERCVAM